MTQPRRVVGRSATPGEETEAPRARSDGALPAQARLLLALQSTAGNRSVTALVQRWRNTSELPPARSALLQRKVLVDGTWYGKNDEAQLQNLKGPKKLPDWKPFHLADDAFYVVDEAGSGWVADTTLLFYRHKRVPDPNKQGEFLYPRQGYAKVGASGRDPFTDVGFGGAGQARVNPKHPDRRTVAKVRLFKYKREIAGHWMLECEVGGGKGVKYAKIDLTKDGYRIYYGVESQKPTTMSDEISFDLEQPTPVRRVYSVFVALAKGKGKWTGTHLYNCQDFALAMLHELRVQQQGDFATAADWRREQRESLGGQPIDA
jgi:hypothetical protein